MTERNGYICTILLKIHALGLKIKPAILLKIAVIILKITHIGLKIAYIGLKIAWHSTLLIYKTEPI